MMYYNTKRSALENLIKSTDTVLDIGFYGQSKLSDNTEWPHRIIIKLAKDVYGIDTVQYISELPDTQSHYSVQSAETFRLNKKFDTIFAGDLIEHLPNPGLFLDCCKNHIQPDGRLIITTPNVFYLDTLIKKVLHKTLGNNPDHVTYFDNTTITQLFKKLGWKVTDIGYIKTLGTDEQKHFKRKIFRAIYKFIGKLTPKFSETLIVVAQIQ